MIKSLFVGDGDEFYLVGKLKTAFDIELTDLENARCHTMGDLEAIVWKQVSARRGTQNRCMTAMAFPALRRALPNTSGMLRPSTPIGNLGLTHLQFARALKRAGLHHDHHNGVLSLVGALAIVGGAAVGLIYGLTAAVQLSGQPLLICAAGAMSASLGYIACRRDPGIFGAIRTIGDASRQLADDNFAFFVERGGRFDRERAWYLLRKIAGKEGGHHPDKIGYETLIIHPRKKWFQIFR